MLGCEAVRSVRNEWKKGFDGCEYLYREGEERKKSNRLTGIYIYIYG